MSYVWDGNGSPTTWRGTSCSYDLEARLTTIGTALTNGYRADGLRAWKQNSATQTWFVYDGATPVCEVNSAGSVTATNTFGATGLLARNSGGSSVLYAFDEAGNTVERLSTSGTVLNQVYTDAFGATTGAASGDPYSGFGAEWGYYTDSETGLMLCGHRFYDSTVGSWRHSDLSGNACGDTANNPNEPLPESATRWHATTTVISDSPCDLRSMFGLLNYWGWLRRRFHSPFTERIAENARSRRARSVSR